MRRGAADRHRRRRGRGAVELSPRQRRLCGGDRRLARRRRRPRERLLHGVTGSGKTEVYLAAIEAALERGRSAILLVPEIGLTPQTLGRVAARLGDRVAVLHSGLSEGERFDEWRRLRSGEARVCVGPRSAVFAPARRPRPDRRRRGARFLLQAGGRPPLRRPRRRPPPGGRRRARSTWPAAPRRGPRAGRSSSGSSCRSGSTAGRCRRSSSSTCARSARAAGPLHPRTREALAGPRRRRPKAIVMLNRRGFSPHLSCASCGERGELPELRRLARPPPRQRGASAATTAATPSRCRRVPVRSAARSRSSATAPGPSASRSSSAS